MARSLWSLLGAPEPFDPQCKFVTSPIFKPLILALIRLTLATYTLATLLIILIRDGVVSHDAQSFLSYFTELTYIGLCAYFWASGVQTISFYLTDKPSYPLHHWPRVLQFLHSLLWSTITTFPFIVTPVFWGLLSGPSTLKTRFDIWENVSIHALNSAFALFEVFFTRIGPQPWLHIPFLILLLAGYLGVAYITHVTQGFYPYKFLDPKKEGAFLAVFIIGIPVAEIIFFTIVQFICWVKAKLGGMDDR